MDQVTIQTTKNNFRKDLNRLKREEN